MYYRTTRSRNTCSITNLRPRITYNNSNETSSLVKKCELLRNNSDDCLTMLSPS
uniref:Uncharacterized protein n=1 Tax=Arundo donax TaxID=35708 RepID=A0A0A8XW22_ARUDO